MVTSTTSLAQTPQSGSDEVGVNQNFVKIPFEYLSHDVSGIVGLDWIARTPESPRLTGELIFKPELDSDTPSALELICAHKPVLHGGEHKAAFVFQGGSDTDVTNEVCARHVMSVFHRFENGLNHAESLILHKPSGQVIAITAPWTDRQPVATVLTLSLPILMVTDPVFHRMILKGSLSRERQSYDESILKRFIQNCGGIERHFRGSHSFRNRFSDFSCKVTYYFGIGVNFTLTFDDQGVFEVAREKIENIVCGRVATNNDGQSHAHPKEDAFSLSQQPIDQEQAGAVSSALNGPDITLVAKWNSPRTCNSMILMLGSVCGFPVRKSIPQQFNLRHKENS